METTRKIKLDEYGNALLTKEESKLALLYGHDIDNAYVTDDSEVATYNKYCEQVLGIAGQILNPPEGIDAAEYHKSCTEYWNIPAKYKALDMKVRLLDLCRGDEEKERVKLEYAMFEERDLIPLLQFLAYIVDYMRDNKIVWGVGRGSSVSSYILYLMGVHKIDSLKYNLPIEEFLK